MPKRRNEIISQETYHVFNRSIAQYEIFNTKEDFVRFMEIVRYYMVPRKVSFSHYLRKMENNKISDEEEGQQPERLIDILGYCIMPTHIHLILKQLTENGILTFMTVVLNSYTHYFNRKAKRKGPLWESRFKNVNIKSDEQLLHLTRYVHLNPVTAYLVENPESWEFSSYNEYCRKVALSEKICRWDELLEIKPESYIKFVEDNISFQRELGKIKKLLME